MADAFVGEIRAMTMSFAPEYWLRCDGTYYSIQQYQALAAVIGTTYGYNQANQTFAVPDLRGFAPVGIGPAGDGFEPVQGHTYGAASVTLTPSQTPVHTHTAHGGLIPVKTEVNTPAGNWLSVATAITQTATPTAMLYNRYATAPAQGTLVAMDYSTLTPFTGQGGAHENRQPYATLVYCICWYGEFPIRP